MKAERVDQLITSYKRRAEELKSRAHMCDAESNQYLDVMDAWQECDDVLTLCEEYKALREVYDELDKAHGDLFIEYSYAMKALHLTCGRLADLSTPSEKFLFDLYLKKAREQE